MLNGSTTRNTQTPSMLSTGTWSRLSCRSVIRSSVDFTSASGSCVGSADGAPWFLHGHKRNKSGENAKFWSWCNLWVLMKDDDRFSQPCGSVTVWNFTRIPNKIQNTEQNTPGTGQADRARPQHPHQKVPQPNPCAKFRHFHLPSPPGMVAANLWPHPTAGPTHPKGPTHPRSRKLPWKNPRCGAPWLLERLWAETFWSIPGRLQLL